MTLTMLGAKPVFLHTSAKEGFLPSPERCAALITPKTKAIVPVHLFMAAIRIIAFRTSG